MDNHILGIDLGGTKIETAVFDEGGSIIGRSRGKTEAHLGSEAVLERIVRIGAEAIQNAGIDSGSLLAIGVGSPGPLDPDTGYIVETANLDFRNFPLGPRLSETFGRPAFVENDVNAGTYGEFKAGAARGASSVLGVFVGTGIGGGLIIDGELYQGFCKNAAEVGHIIVKAGGPRCGCGRRGCLEALASRTAMTRRIRKQVKLGEKTLITKLVGKRFTEVPSKALKQAYEAGDDLVVEVVRDAAWYAGLGIGSLVNVLNPEVIVLGGGVIEALGDEIIGGIESSIRATAFEYSMRGVRVVRASLGDDAGITGAAILARERVSSRPEDAAAVESAV
jgi:glucokinase